MNDARFVAACTTAETLVPESLVELAVAGRSNCGKSSLINALSRRKKLARTSSTPGRTRQIVFFRLEMDGSPPFHLVDLPGYGYAKVSRALKSEWGDFVSNYVESRQALRLVLLLMDIRRDPRQEEIDLLTWLGQRGIEPIVILTKADKLAKNRRFGAVQRLTRALGLRRKPQAVSIQDRAGIDALRRQLLAAVTNLKSPENSAI